MRKKLMIATAAGALTLSGLAVAVPALASPGSTGSAVDRISEALSGLVSDGSLTQEQADEVATTLSDAGIGRHGDHDGHRGGGPGLAAAATALGLTEEELRTALEADGATLAQVAEDEGVELGTLIDAMVTAEQERIAQAVEDGDLTQAQADERLAGIEQRITERVNGAGPAGPRGHGHHGDRDGRADGDGADDDGSETPAD